MPKVPTVATASLGEVSTLKVLNNMRAQASDYYKSAIPIASNSKDINRIGTIMQTSENLAREFMTFLWSRIAKVMITSKQWNNPLAFLKQGEIELGEVIEEVFVNPAKAHVYDDENIPDEAALRREYPEIFNQLHFMNYQTYYKVSVFNNDFRRAFLSFDGVEDLIAKIVESLYSGAYLDEYYTTVYMVARKILDGGIGVVDSGDFITDPKNTTVVAKEISNNLVFPHREFNQAGVVSFTPKSDQYYLITSAYDARESVEVLASAFNIDKVEFMGRRILVDSFAEIDWSRADNLFKYNKDYRHFTQSEIEALKRVPMVVLDKDFFRIFDNLNQFTEIYNPEKLFWTYFYHVWRTFSVSAFMNAVAFVNGKPTVDSISVNPEKAELEPGTGILLNAEITGSEMVSKHVDWYSDNVNITVNSRGYVYVQENATGSATITATSVADPTKTATATITVKMS